MTTFRPDGRVAGGPETVDASPARTPARPAPLFRPLGSRLHPPRPCLALVRRGLLLESLHASSAPLVLVSAPAGAGKTTLLLQWFNETDLPRSWLQLDRDANDPVVLLTYAALALARIADVSPAVLEWLRLPAPPVREAIVPALCAAIAAAPPFVLVIDDGHLLMSDVCWALLGTLLEALPRDARVALGTRRDPDLPLARLRAAGRLQELRFSELALDGDEAMQLLRMNGRQADAQALQTLLNATEGWAAGLYLAALSGSGSGVALDGGVHADRREVAQYLLTEVLEQQPPALRRFLLETSILERLCSGLCRSVTGRTDSADLLRSVARDNLFVWALGETDEWYRYHHLFAEFLQAELRRASPGQVARLHSKAARWFDANGDVGEAVRHWLAAGEIAKAADLVASAWSPYTLSGQAETVRSWLALFSDQQILAYPPLTLTAAYVRSIFGDAGTGEVWQRATGDDTDGPSPDGAASLRSSRAMLRAAFAFGGATQMRRDVQLAAGLEIRSGSPWHAMANLLLGLSRIVWGELDEAAQPLQIAVDEGAVFNALTEVAAGGYLSLLASERGRWEEARTHFEKAAARMEEYRLSDFPNTVHVHVAKACLCAHRGDPGLWDEIEHVRRVLDHAPPWPWATMLASCILGEICLRRGRLDETERWLARAQAAHQSWPDAGALPQRVEHLRVGLQQRLGIDPLTSAEARVLELLPTQLTVDEIATRLILSANTVKSHVGAIYRKLAVSSRTEAVERARELGLLEK